jgi:polysaccharide export outer membrane protein
LVALGERTTPNGQELLAEFIQYGHQKPFEEIVRRYAGMVYNVCYRITKDKHEAEDATQAVFLTLALQAKRGAEIKALGPWLQQVGKRLALDTRRSKKRRQSREERHQTEQTVRRESLLDDALPSADLDELKTILHEELQKLPAKYRMPLILHYFGGLSRDEMAAELNCKASTLGVRIFRGREMLAGRLSSRGINI